MKKFKFSNFFNSSNSRKSLIAVISILLVICMIVSISYAFFVVLPGDRYELSTTVDIPSCASVTLSNTTSLNLSGDIAAPISDKKALSSDNYAFEFTVSNACRVASSLKISLAPTIESTMPIRAIKYALVEKGTNLPSEGNYLLQENNQKKLTSQIVTDIKKQTGSVVELGYEVLNSTLASGATKNYILYLWIDYYEGDPSQSGQFNNTTMNKSFNAYLVVSDYSQTEGGEYRNYLSDEILGLVSNNEYTSSQDGTKYVVKHEEVRYEGTTYDAGVRYEGNAPDNYITFNGNEEWRIIGTFEGSTIGLEPGKQYTKIIRNTSMHKLWDCSYWSDDTGACEGNSENDWANSSLNAYLNGEYLSSLTDANKIAKYNGNYSTWYLRGMDYENHTGESAYTPNWYLAERITGTPGYKDGVAGDANATATGAIGIMYPSDYGYAAYGNSCDNKTSETLYNFSGGCSEEDWLLLENDYEWLISPSPNSFYVYGVGFSGEGCVDDGHFAGELHAVRPVLYLESDVYITEGTGTKSDPYKIDRDVTLSETVLAKVSDSEYTSSQDGTEYVVIHEEIIRQDDEMYQNVKNYGDEIPQMYVTYGGYTESDIIDDFPSYIKYNGLFTMSTEGVWTSVPSAMEASHLVGTHNGYLINLPLESDGYYRFCYNFGAGVSAIIGKIANDGSMENALLNASTSNGVNTCQEIGTLEAADMLRIYFPENGSFSAFSFWFQKADTIDAGVRYEGNDPDNYITFNGNEEWRIIGVFEGSTIGLEPGKQYTKIIRNTPMMKAWDEDDKNDWANSTSKAYLNEDYLHGNGQIIKDDKNKNVKSLLASSKDKIAKYNGNYSTWYLRGMDPDTHMGDNAYTPDWYLAERITGTPGYKDGEQGAAGATTTGAIGLMYPSDYGYAAYGTNCDNKTSMTLYYYEDGCAEDDWLLLEDDIEWLISPGPDDSDYAFIVDGSYGGYVGNSNMVKDKFAVRPVLYLEASVMIASGDGTKANPYILK